MTVAAALDAAVKRLKNHSTSARLDAEVLLAFVCRMTRLNILISPERRLTAIQARRFRPLIERRRQHFPVPYLTGQVEFFGLTLRVTPDVLVPRPFTESILEAFLDKLPATSSATIVDIGTGSGAIALSIAQARPEANIIGTDMSLAALRVARANAAKLLPERRLRWYLGSLLQALPPSILPDHLFANLPYLTSHQLREPSVRREPRLALYGGTNGLRYINDLLRQARTYTSLQSITLELDPAQVPAVRRLLRRWSPGCTIQSISDGRRIRGLIARR